MSVKITKETILHNRHLQVSYFFILRNTVVFLKINIINLFCDCYAFRGTKPFTYLYHIVQIFSFCTESFRSEDFQVFKRFP